MDKTICELFAGVGGFRIGFESQSKEWKTVWANQWEPGKKLQHAFNCYKTHFNDFGGVNEFSNTDISKVDVKNIPNFSLIVGGFPCQDYSIASTGALGIEGKKGVLWWEINRIVEAKHPSFILLENVDRLLKSPSSQRGRDFGVILACLTKLGYSVEWRVINAAEYGFQQRRRRTFIFASHKNTNYNKNLKLLSEESILSKEGFFSSKFPVDNFNIDDLLNKSIHISDDNDLLNISNSFEFTFKNSGICVDGHITTIDTTPSSLLKTPPLTLRDIIETDVDEAYYIKQEDLEKWQYMKGAKAIERTSSTGYKYMFREGAVAFPDPIDKPARTMLTSERSKNRSTHVIEDLNSKRLRLLTPIECERINGFPDNWTNTGMPNSFRYFCMGNALVVDLIKIMAENLYKIIEKED